MAKSSQTSSTEEPNGKDEIRLDARAVSRGIAVGTIVCLYGNSRNLLKKEIDPIVIGPEVERLRRAFERAKRRLDAMSAKRNGATTASSAILGAQKAMLGDPTLEEEMKSAVAEKHVNAEWAVKLVIEKHVADYKTLPDEHLRDRYLDIEDIGEQLLNALGTSNSKGRAQIGENAVIAGEELRPSTLAELADAEPKALITEHGGWTSHTFILARELEIPAVTGLKKLLRRVKTGDPVVVDGYNGRIIVNPSPTTIARFRAEAVSSLHREPENQVDASGPLLTLDGRKITIRANLDLPSGYAKAKRLGAQGVGLYRSEFLHDQFKGFPSENEQIAAYRELAVLAGAEGVRIRTFDLGLEQFKGSAREREKNPALGLRGIRLSFAFKKHLATQVRALLRASAGQHLDIIVPLVSGLAEMREVKQIIERERGRLEKKGTAVGTPGLGAMIEVPSAVLLAKELAEECDLICLGTNDLIQYLLAVDRDNETVADWFRTLHPSVIRSIGTVVDACDSAGKPLVVCGEMAGSPFYIPLLVGLGVTELSMNVNSIPRVRAVAAGIAFEETRELVREAARCRTADEIEKVLLRHIQEKWSHLYPAGFFTNRTL